MSENLNDWLTRKKLTIRDFSDACGVDYGTAVRWFRADEPSKPKRMASVIIAAVFPDCPLVKGRRGLSRVWPK